jgi:hypothetical protein
MNDKEFRDLQELESIPTITKLIATILATSGLLLISISLLIPDGGRWCLLLRELTKELGIVVLAVFGVSLLYELVLAKRYIKTFVKLLGREMMKGESNATVCALLGVRKIFPTRDTFEKEVSLLELVAHLRDGGHLRIVARSLFLLMSKHEAIKQAVKYGANVELCLLSPLISPSRASRLSDLEVSDIQAAVSVFTKKLIHWIRIDSQIDSKKPAGKIELRFHDVDLFDSFLLLKSRFQTVACWDLSFGRDVSAKRVFVLDPNGPLGTDLSQRYDLVYESAEVVFKYDGNKIVEDKLSQP